MDSARTPGRRQLRRSERRVSAMATKQEPPMALGESIRNPLGKELLRRCVLAGRPLHLDELAASMEQPRFRVRFHAAELAKLGALKESEALWPWRPAGRRYEATPMLMNFPMGAGGARPDAR